MHLWRKTVSPARADSWAGRLTGAVGAERLVLIESPRSQRLEIYCPTAAEARELARHFGGQTRELPDAVWRTPAPAATAARPLAIGRRLLVTGRAEALGELRAAHPGRGVLAVPAAMAFGTGEHATTAMCLRFLEEIARPPALAPGAWELLDLGTGSGILALTGRLLGARATLGLDNDPHAVRTARENATLNAVRAVRFTRADLLAWTPTRAWPVVTANLFSDLLIRLLPTAIAPALAPGGRLIASGVLGTQADEVTAAFRRAGLELLETRSRGRWRAFLCKSFKLQEPRGKEASSFKNQVPRRGGERIRRTEKAWRTQTLARRQARSAPLLPPGFFPSSLPSPPFLEA